MQTLACRPQRTTRRDTAGIGRLLRLSLPLVLSLWQLAGCREQSSPAPAAPLPSGHSERHARDGAEAPQPDQEQLDQIQRAQESIRASLLAQDVGQALANIDELLELLREAYGESHPRTLATLRSKASFLEDLDEFDDAQQVRESTVELCTERFGAHDWRVIDAKLELADTTRLSAFSVEQRQMFRWAEQADTRIAQLDNAGKLREAFELAGGVLEIRRELLGEEHYHYCHSLNDMGMLFLAAKQIERAVECFEKVAEVEARILGEQHPNYATTLNNLADSYRVAARYEDAERTFLRSKRLHEIAFGAKSEQLARVLNNLGVLYQEQGSYQKAGDEMRRALEIWEEVLEPNDPSFTISWNNLGYIHYLLSEFDEAERCYQLAARNHLANFDKVHPDYARVLNNLGILHDRRAEYRQAIDAYQEALKIRKAVLSDKHPDYARALQNLGLTYMAMGAYARAEPLMQECQRVWKEIYTENHPQYADVLNTLGSLYSQMKDDGRAERNFRLSLAIRRQTLPPDHPEIAKSLNNLAATYSSMGENAKAEPLYVEALDLKRKSLGPTHPGVARSLQNLSVLYRASAQPEQALRCIKQALEIREAAPHHPEYAATLDSLANHLADHGDYRQAGEHYRRALKILGDSVGENHPNYSTVLHNEAVLFFRQRDYKAAERNLRRSVEVSFELLRLTADTQSDRQQLQMASRLRHELDSYLSVAPLAGISTEEIYQHVLDWKGSVFARQRRLRILRGDPRLQSEFEKLQSTSTRLATLALTIPGEDATTKDVQDWLKKIQDLTDLRREHERALMRNSQALQRHDDPQRRSVARLVSVLPANVTLVDFLQYNSLHHDAEKPGGLDAERHLLVFAVRRDQPVLSIDLGPMDEITAAIAAWRRSGLGSRASVPANELRRRLWEPLAGYVRGAEIVLLSPDGELARLPLAALPGREAGTFLIEEAAIAVSPIPQTLSDMLEQPPAAPSARDSLLLVGGVDFDSEAGTFSSTIENEDYSARTQPTIGGAGRKRFRRLPGTQREVEQIRSLFAAVREGGTVKVLQDSQATEDRFRRLAPGSRYLHLATHGFFSPPPRAQIENAESARIFAEAQSNVVGYHHGLLSGLALSGSNRPLTSPDKDDGVLTALELAGIDLTTVDLAVLSACESGLGTVIRGEGVLGLQRAFEAGGSRSTVTTLWSVQDIATQQIMAEFYRNLWERDLGKLAALRQAQLAMLRREPKLIADLQTRGLEELAESSPGRTAPAYWAAFVLSGDWR